MCVDNNRRSGSEPSYREFPLRFVARHKSASVDLSGYYRGVPDRRLFSQTFPRNPRVAPTSGGP